MTLSMLSCETPAFEEDVPDSLEAAGPPIADERPGGRVAICEGSGATNAGAGAGVDADGQGAP
jgi:hypothetical protein